MAYPSFSCRRRTKLVERREKRFLPFSLCLSTRDCTHRIFHALFQNSWTHFINWNCCKYSGESSVWSIDV